MLFSGACSCFLFVWYSDRFAMNSDRDGTFTDLEDFYGPPRTRRDSDDDDAFTTEEEDEEALETSAAAASPKDEFEHSQEDLIEYSKIAAMFSPDAQQCCSLKCNQVLPQEIVQETRDTFLELLKEEQDLIVLAHLESFKECAEMTLRLRPRACPLPESEKDHAKVNFRRPRKRKR